MDRVNYIIAVYPNIIRIQEFIQENGDSMRNPLMLVLIDMIALAMIFSFYNLPLGLGANTITLIIAVFVGVVFVFNLKNL